MSRSLNDELCASLIHNLTFLRRQYGLTKKAMAQLLRISLYSLNLLEKGTIPPHLGVEMIFQAQDCFDVTIQHLFEKRL